MLTQFLLVIFVSRPIYGDVVFSEKSPFAEVDAASNNHDLSSRLRQYLTDNSERPNDVNYVWAEAKLGMVLQEIDMRGSAPTAILRDEALHHLHGAIAAADKLVSGIDQDLLYFWNLRLAVLLHSMGRSKEAADACDTALSLAVTPGDKATALYHLGDNLLMMGQPAEALQHFQNALDLAPERLTIFRDIVRCHKQLGEYSSSDWFLLLEALEAALADFSKQGALEPGNEILWVLHQVAESAELYHEAWKYLQQAREAEHRRRASWGEEYNSRIAGEKSRSIIAAFHKKFWPAASSNVGSTSMLPVFIVGLPRSGSTLLESILEAHASISTTREDSALAARVGLLQEEERNLREMFLSASGGSSGRFEEAYSAAWRNMIKAHADNITATMRQEAFIVTGTKSPKRIVDKLLTNYKHVGLIHLLFPKAIILHIVRDPRDTVLSQMKHNFAHPSLGWTMRNDDMLGEYAQYLDVMSHFKSVLPAGRIVDIKYEELVNKPEFVLRSIFSRIGVKWDSEVLTKFYKNERHYILTPSFLQVREKLNNQSIGIWKKYAPEPEYQSFLVRLKRLIDTAGLANDGRSLDFINTRSWELS